jgi:hypothetical protein
MGKWGELCFVFSFILMPCLAAKAEMWRNCFLNTVHTFFNIQLKKIWYSTCPSVCLSVHESILTDCQRHDNRCSDNHSSLWGVNEFLSLHFTFTSQFEKNSA